MKTLILSIAIVLVVVTGYAAPSKYDPAIAKVEQADKERLDALGKLAVATAQVEALQSDFVRVSGEKTVLKEKLSESRKNDLLKAGLIFAVGIVLGAAVGTATYAKLQVRVVETPSTAKAPETPAKKARVSK
jgi:hypothetical protein